MSIYSKAEMTMIEGVVYYDSTKVEEQLKAMEAEKRKLISQMLMEKEKGVTTQSPPNQIKREFTCETLD
jgi:predicted RNA-binding protein Jag